jgi:hypothetical protein
MFECSALLHPEKRKCIYMRVALALNAVQSKDFFHPVWHAQSLTLIAGMQREK